MPVITLVLYFGTEAGNNRREAESEYTGFKYPDNEE